MKSGFYLKKKKQVDFKSRYGKTALPLITMIKYCLKCDNYDVTMNETFPN